MKREVRWRARWFLEDSGEKIRWDGIVKIGESVIYVLWGYGYIFGDTNVSCEEDWI